MNLLRLLTVIPVLFTFACWNPVPAQAADSPEVLADGKVTFRLAAPKAEKVLVMGDWLKRGEQIAMTKGTDGVWTATTGPLPPGSFIYDFDVDGLRVPDPENHLVKLRADRVGSFVHIPGDAIWQSRKVPHGAVDINFHDSAALGDPRWMFVYTPPGYTQDTGKKYPVLYLLHGNNDTAAGWVTIGAANFILDNLLAEGKCQEMIVVMPFGHALPFGTRGDNTGKFEEYLLKDVVPLIEGKYRTLADREHRAIVGLSMGGGQALTIGFRNLDKFSVVGSFSGAVPANFDTQFAEALKDPAAVNGKLKLLWTACGKDDSLIGRNRELDQLLTTRGIKHTFRETEGVHNYEAWRRYLTEITPLLFRE